MTTGWVVPERRTGTGIVKRALLVVIGLFILGSVITSMGSWKRAAAPLVTERPPVLLASLVTLEWGGCSPVGGLSGTVTNGSGETVSIFISGQFLSEGGTVLDDGLDSISGVRPGETANFNIGYLGPERSLAKCRANVDSVYRD